MKELNPKIIKIKAKILTPIHIDNGEVLDRMDYFCFEGWDVIQILDRKWLNFCAEKDRELFNNIIKNIEIGHFLKVENYKNDFYSNYSEEFISKYGIKKELKIGDNAINSLLQNKEYELQKNQKGNQGEIKRFSRFGLNKDLIIPGSTLKGLFRTMFLNDKISNLEGNYKLKSKELEKIDNENDFKKELFAFLQFEDIKFDDYFLEIQQINSENKPKKEGDNSKKGPPQIIELINEGKFDIIINDIKGQIDISKLEKIIKNYSTALIAREEQILDNIEFNGNILDKLDENFNDNNFPIKIGMFKKSLSYKLFWEEMIENLNNNYSGKEWLDKSKKLGIGDKMIYVDENQNPLGWIGLSDIQILEK